MKRIAVIGDGGWGTALALLLDAKGHRVRIWGAFPEYLSDMRRRRENVKFLKGVALSPSIELIPDPADAVADADLVVSAVPTRFLRNVLVRFEPILDAGVPIVSVTKGIEEGTLRRPSQIIHEVLGRRPVAVLSGPSHAEEVARGLPASVVVASSDESIALAAQQAFMADRFRVYTHDDLVGIELGGALKNVIALAAGICDGLGFGDNAKAALLTRGIVEIARLGAALGARKGTFHGLSGMGDLITTCISPHGRNRSVGIAIGRGQSLEGILAGMEMVAEGVFTTRAARTLSKRYGVEMPITEEVYRVLFKRKSPARAVRDLMKRGRKPESDLVN
ncbi:MAG: NAD(P)-dependent glycerol-3-phosphate dehydrogenase [Planctomycetes bacterium]|nr:NAD(P)-dependent glycerol-3-phosphate dehydrogenase [Planctomycetota bacterium]MBI3843858.1 NAD(P)-dependent glycerol-3-phosphate dehydrogenase [Planctomycetota bacterium]